jgi:hypothetical protein
MALYYRKIGEGRDMVLPFRDVHAKEVGEPSAAALSLPGAHRLIDHWNCWSDQHVDGKFRYELTNRAPPPVYEDQGTW